MKVALVDQIAEAERHRDDLEASADGNPDVTERLHRAEGILMTLSFVQTYEQGFREFFRSKQEARS